MCRNGLYTERGIKEIDGSLGLLGVLLVLLEPTTVVTKAWEQVIAVGQCAF